MSASSEDDEKLPSDSGHSHTSSSDSDSDDGDFSPPPQQQHHFAPPFYGRPPTPLPPSPSLTSLLRPSRPTTPDASDVDDAHAPHALEPVPRAAPRVPTYEYYGFVLYLFSSLTFLVYLLWSYLPSPFLHALGIYYYPNRWWSLAIPSFLVMALVFIYVALASYNTEILTLPLGSIETIVDEAGSVAAVDLGRGRGVLSSRKSGASRRRKEKDRERDRDRESRSSAKEVDWKMMWNEGTNAVTDVPLAGVCEVLYG